MAMGTASVSIRPEARDQLCSVLSADDVTTGGRPFSCGVAAALLPGNSRYDVGDIEVVGPPWFDQELGACVQGLPMEMVVVAAGCCGGPSVDPTEASCQDVFGEWTDGGSASTAPLPHACQ